MKQLTPIYLKRRNDSNPIVSTHHTLFGMKGQNSADSSKDSCESCDLDIRGGIYSCFLMARICFLGLGTAICLLLEVFLITKKINSVPEVDMPWWQVLMPLTTYLTIMSGFGLISILLSIYCPELSSEKKQKSRPLYGLLRFIVTVVSMFSTVIVWIIGLAMDGIMGWWVGIILIILVALIPIVKYFICSKTGQSPDSGKFLDNIYDL